MWLYLPDSSPLFSFARRLPIGIAGLLASCFGIARVVVRMSQVWYTGPIGKMAGVTSGADLGFEFCSRDVPTSSMVGDSLDGKVVFIPLLEPTTSSL
ncbi:hypothetical protein OG21DRAFT_1211179 [Imleria badia]|nr:hypothetical protein OG21DRAFT_1211179 [Imleria badia]